MKLIPKKLTRDQNAAYIGLAGEVVTITGIGAALHDGHTAGGIIIEQNIEFASDNIVRNSNFSFTQNGSTFLGNSAAKTHVMDGWFIQHAGSSTSNVAQSSTYDTTLQSKNHCIATTFTGGLSSSFTVLSQRYARPEQFGGKRLTLSFWAKCNLSQRIAVEFGQTFADVGTLNRNILVGNAELTSSWQKFEFTFDVPDLSASDVIDNNVDHSFLYLWLEAGDDYNARTGGILPFSGSFNIGNIKLEQSSKATEYEFNYENERAKVFEYFEKSSHTQFMSALGVTSPATDCGANISFGYPKWTTAPDVSITSSFVNAPSIISKDSFGFSVIGVANSATSAARITAFTIDAEFDF